MKESSDKFIRKAESRERILNAASLLFREQGYTATGVDALMAEAGLTAGAFYAHFKSKQDLFDCVIDHILRKGVSHFTGGLQLENNQQIVQELMLRYVSEHHRDHPENGCLLPSVAAEIGRHSHKGKHAIGAHLDRWAKLFEKGGQSRETSLRLIAQAVGAVLLARMVPRTLSKEILESAAKVGPTMR